MILEPNILYTTSSSCRLAMLLTKNELGLSFYLTDWAAENFAVATDSMKVSYSSSPHGMGNLIMALKILQHPELNFLAEVLLTQVSLVDLEHLIVVNTSRLEAEAADAHISDNWGSR